MVLDWRALLAGLWLVLTLVLGVGLWHYRGAAEAAQEAAEEAQKALADYSGQVTRAEATAAKHRAEKEKLRVKVNELARQAEAGHGPCGAEPIPVHVLELMRQQAAAASARP